MSSETKGKKREIPGRVIAEFCTCIWTHDPNQPGTAHIYQADPRCPLHGRNVERSPF